MSGRLWNQAREIEKGWLPRRVQYFRVLMDSSARQACAPPGLRSAEHAPSRLGLARERGQQWTWFDLSPLDQAVAAEPPEQRQPRTQRTLNLQPSRRARLMYLPARTHHQQLKRSTAVQTARLSADWSAHADERQRGQHRHTHTQTHTHTHTRARAQTCSHARFSSFVWDSLTSSFCSFATSSSSALFAARLSASQCTTGNTDAQQLSVGRPREAHVALPYPAASSARIRSFSAATRAVSAAPAFPLAEPTCCAAVSSTNTVSVSR